MTRAFGRRLMAATASLIALVLVHHATYLLAHGSAYDTAMSATGHDGFWTAWVGGVGLAAGVLAVVAAWQIRRLARLVQGAGAGVSVDGGLRDYLRSVRYWWARLLISVTLLFVLQENVERAGVGPGMPGLGVLYADQYGLATPVIIAVTLVVALVIGLFQWCRRSLLARLLAATHQSHREGVRRSTATADRQLIALLLARRSAGRAPPVPA